MIKSFEYKNTTMKVIWDARIIWNISITGTYGIAIIRKCSKQPTGFPVRNCAQFCLVACFWSDTVK